ncbi:MAG: hypothetical protein R2771_10365 [Saprospiraceae bacterium]
MFSVSENAIKSADNFVDDALYLNVDNELLHNLYSEKYNYIKLNIPISNDEICEMTLERFDVFTDDYILKTSEGAIIENYNPGIFYRGKLTNHNGIATICIFKDDINGIISIENVGNFNLGKLTNSDTQYVIYNDQKVKVDMGTECHSDELNSLDIEER